MNKFCRRFLAACRSLHKDVTRRGFDSGSELIGIMELSNGRTLQFHLTVVSDELEFIDADGPTGCADDLSVSVADFKDVNNAK